jgi:hypothetical protein
LSRCAWAIVFQVENCSFKQLVDYNEVKLLSLCHFGRRCFVTQLIDVVTASSPRPEKAGAQWSSQLGSKGEDPAALENSKFW